MAKKLNNKEEEILTVKKIMTEPKKESNQPPKFTPVKVSESWGKPQKK